MFHANGSRSPNFTFFGNEGDTTYGPSDHVHTSGGDLKLLNLTSFGKCMACRMFFHVFAHEQMIALCLDGHRTRVGQILKEWAPKWAAIGMELSCLDITPDYIFKEVPEKNLNLGMPCLVFVDVKIGSLHLKDFGPFSYLLYRSGLSV